MASVGDDNILWQHFERIIEHLRYHLKVIGSYTMIFEREATPFKETIMKSCPFCDDDGTKFVHCPPDCSHNLEICKIGGCKSTWRGGVKLRDITSHTKCTDECVPNEACKCKINHEWLTLLEQIVMFKQLRKCSICGDYGDHDKRSCPDRENISKSLLVFLEQFSDLDDSKDRDYKYRNANDEDSECDLLDEEDLTPQEQFEYQINSVRTIRDAVIEQISKHGMTTRQYQQRIQQYIANAPYNDSESDSDDDDYNDSECTSDSDSECSDDIFDQCEAFVRNSDVLQHNVPSIRIPNINQVQPKSSELTPQSATGLPKVSSLERTTVERVWAVQTFADTCACIADLNISYGDLRLLNPHLHGTQQKWLNDNIINSVMCLISARSVVSNTRVLTFGSMASYFYTLLTVCNTFQYEKVRSMTESKNINIFMYNTVLIPINHGQVHWGLAVINVRARQFEYYDSAVSSRYPSDAILSNLRTYACLERNRVGSTETPEEWDCVVQKQIPQQVNGFDCGVFVCAFAESISRDASFAFSQADMCEIRYSIASSILKNKIV